MPTNILVFGAPNSGKGTVSRYISKELGLYHLSTGDLIREHISAGTKFGIQAQDFISNGKLVPDDLVFGLVKTKIDGDEDCVPGVVFDGFPRTVWQAKELQKLCKIDAVLFLDVDDESVLFRAVNRRVCPVCKKNFSLITLNGKTTCDECGATLIARQDSQKELIEKILETYKKETTPLIDFYKDKMIRIDAKKSPNEVANEVLQKLKEALKK